MIVFTRLRTIVLKGGHHVNMGCLNDLISLSPSLRKLDFQCALLRLQPDLCPWAKISWVASIHSIWKLLPGTCQNCFREQIAPWMLAQRGWPHSSGTPYGPNGRSYSGNSWTICHCYRWVFPGTELFLNPQPRCFQSLITRGVDTCRMFYSKAVRGQTLDLNRYLRVILSPPNSSSSRSEIQKEAVRGKFCTASVLDQKWVVCAVAFL